MLQEPEVIAAIVGGSCNILAAMIAAATAAIIGKKFADRKKLQSELEKTISDIHFLLEVEKIHCELHRGNNGQSNKNTVRSKAKQEWWFGWSGLFTPGRVRSNLED